MIKEDNPIFDKSALKEEIKEELIEEWKDEVKDVVKDSLDKLVGPIVAEKLGNLFDFPLTVNQLATLSGRKKNTIYKMCERNQIPYTRVGKFIHINIKDVNHHLLNIE